MTADTKIRDDAIYVSTDLVKQYRFIARLEKEANADSMICRVLTGYIIAKYGDKIETVMAEAGKAYKKVLDEAEDSMKQETP